MKTELKAHEIRRFEQEIDQVLRDRGENISWKTKIYQ